MGTQGTPWSFSFPYQTHLSLMDIDEISGIRKVLASESLTILEDAPGVLTVVFNTAGEAARVADAVAGGGAANGPNVFHFYYSSSDFKHIQHRAINKVRFHIIIILIIGSALDSHLYHTPSTTLI